VFQHYRGSTPPSDDEQRSYINAASVDVITPQYRRLEGMCAALRAQGVDSTFLGHLFATTGETVYADDCCHLNAYGVRLLNEAIADHVVTSGVLASISPAAQ